jgi:very-short-patch-repair endonuclease
MNKSSKITKETRLKMSIAAKGKHKSTEHKFKIGLSNKGKGGKGSLIENFDEDRICSYGCGQRALYILLNKKFCCCDTVAKCPNIRIKNSLGGRGKSKPESYKKKLSERMKGNKLCKGHTSPMKGKKHTKECLEKMGKICKERFKDPDYLEKWINGQRSSPNKLEIILIDLLKDNFKYVGDHSSWIDGKNPDFINEDNKLIIEFFGDWFHGEEYRRRQHGDYSTNEEHEIERIKHFEKNGYKCLVIWEHELKNIEEIMKRVNNFIRENT